LQDEQVQKSKKDASSAGAFLHLFHSIHPAYSANEGRRQGLCVKHFITRASASQEAGVKM
jgi:hypothetical protein